MKRFVRMLIIVLAVLMTCAASGQAAGFHGGGRGGSFSSFRGGGRGGSFGHFHGGGRGWGGGWGWGPAVGLGLWGLTYPYYGYPYYQAPVVIQEPSTEIYVQPNMQQSAEPSYWYYCQEAKGYYPYVKRCPSGWMKVVPSPPPVQ